jgi:hypothetical protein
MFCRRCETDYGVGAVACPRCGGRLQEGTPGAARGEAADPVPVFETADSALLPVLKSVLDGAGLPYVVQGDQIMGLLPLGPFGIGVRKSVLGAVILVPRDRVAEARAVLLDAGHGGDAAADDD